MITNWKLVSGVTAFVNNITNELYLANNSKPSKVNAVAKLVKNSKQVFKIELNDCKFTLKLNEHLKVAVKSDSLPKKDNWYTVKNFIGEYNLLEYRNDFIASILTQLDNTKGDFGDNSFEAVFSDSAANSVYLIAPGMKEYDACSKEMNRLSKCQLFKKTKSLTVGHRYDSEKETLYYLGAFKSRKIRNINTLRVDFASEEKNMKTVHLFTHEIGNASTISEVIKNGVFDETKPNGLLVKSTTAPMVDSGKELENDLTDIRTLWDEMFNNAINKYVETDSHGVELIKYSAPIFDIFTIQNDGFTSYDVLSETIKSSLKSLLHNSIEKSAIKYINSDQMGLINDENGKYTALISKTFLDFPEDNKCSATYYSTYFCSIGVVSTPDELNDMAKKEVDHWSTLPAGLLSDFHNYLKWNEVYSINHYDLYKTFISDQRKVSSSHLNNSWGTKKYLYDFFGQDTPLTNIIKKMAIEAAQNCGLNVKFYDIINVGTTNSPNQYDYIIITLEDIVNYCGDSMTEELKQSILDNVFGQIKIYCDHNSSIV